ncbi:MAG: hypothetical protein ACL7BU_10880 [Candidatus Phlomobacter fragariae]
MLTLSVGYIGFSYAETGYDQSNIPAGNFLIIGFPGLTMLTFKDANNVYKLIGTNSSAYSDMGAFRFIKLDDANIYLSEWTQDNNMSSASHTAY